MTILEVFVTDRIEEINILRENNESMIIQISENVRMKRKLGVQDRVIKNCKEHPNSIYEELKEVNTCQKADHFDCEN